MSERTPKAGPRPANALWGGRFETAPDALMVHINASIDVDKRLWREDIAGSKAHARMLAAQGILPQEDLDAILGGLDRIAGEIEAGAMAFTPALEDIHMHIEARLKELVGAPAGRLHTARSRNDQVATDLRLWLRGALAQARGLLRRLQRALVEQAERHAATVMPGFTHLQIAQPVTFGHHLLAYVEMAERDHDRLADAARRLNECPLGAAALAGTSFPIDREATARALGFARPCANSLDAVSARDFALEALAAAAIAAQHLSRLAEELVLWSSPAFALVRLSDAFTTGSSIMPQKRNPDAAELVRAKTGRIAGAFQALIMVMKGLPLAYGKDMQEDKALVFEAFDDLHLCLAAMAGMILDLKADEARMRAMAEEGFATATDLADHLVAKLGLPFREAHHVTGRIVAAAEAAKVKLAAMPLAELRRIEPRLGEDVYGVLSLEASLGRRASFGGTAPDRVRAELAKWKGHLAREETSP